MVSIADIGLGEPVGGRAAGGVSGPSADTGGGRAAIELDAISKRFSGAHGEVTALDEVTQSIALGEFVSIVGPSGCGKTTLLRIMAGLEAPSSGALRFGIDNGKWPTTSMVFQEHGIFPWMTVLDNASYGLTVRGVSKADRYEVARGYLQTLGLSGFERAYPHQLSGGMRQRVNLARSFAVGSPIQLMDEPMASLDEYTKMHVQGDLLELWRTTRQTVVFITHSLDEAITLADRVLVMTKRPGRVKACFPIDLERPRDVMEIRNDERFLRLRARIWEALREEVREPTGPRAAGR